MDKFIVRPSEPSDGEALAPNLRLADRREIIAMTGESARNGLKSAIEASTHCWTALIDEEPIAIFGYCSDSSNNANIWLLGSDKIKATRFQFLRESKKWLKKIVEDFDRVWAIADVRNKAHKDWYKWLGFDIVTTVNMGPFMLPFYHIEYVKEASNV